MHCEYTADYHGDVIMALSCKHTGVHDKVHVCDIAATTAMSLLKCPYFTNDSLARAHARTW